MKHSTNVVSILILAAGESSRMGTSKQLLEIQGEPLLRRAAKSAINSSAAHVTVVLGASESSHFPVIQDLPLSAVRNQDWSLGMGRSIKVGLDKIMTMHPSTNAILVMVCDQPYLDSSYLDHLIRQPVSTDFPVAASRYQDTLGVPALFHHSIFEELREMPDHQGAKSLVRKYRQSTIVVDFPHGEVDLDTPEDVKQFIEQEKTKTKKADPEDQPS